MKKITTSRAAISPVILALATFLSCGIETPQAPSWDIDINIPVVSHRYDMLEIIDRMAEDIISYDSTGLISLNVEEELDTVIIDAGLSVAGLTTTFSETLGIIDVATPEPLTETVPLGDHIFTGGDVPPDTIEVEKVFTEIPEIESATISTGEMVVTVTNEFGIPLASVILSIIDIDRSEMIGTVDFSGGLDPGESGVLAIDLSGKTISNALSFSAVATTPGGYIENIDGKYMTVEAAFPDGLAVSEARAVIEPQTRHYERTISLSDSGDNTITAATVKSGSLEITLTNETCLGAVMEIEIPGIIEGGIAELLSIDLPPGGTGRITSDLAGKTVTPVPGTTEPSIFISVTAELSGSGAEAVDVSSSDRFDVDIEVSELFFSDMSGTIEPVRFEIDPFIADIDVPDGFETFDLTAATLTLEILSAAGLPVEIDLALATERGDSMRITGSVSPGSFDDPVLTIIETSDLDRLLCPIPSSISVSGSVTAGDGITRETVTENAYICGKVIISSPMEVVIGETEFEADINEAELDAEEFSDNIDRMNRATLYSRIINHMPIELSMTLYVGTDSLSLYSAPHLLLGPFFVRAGTVVPDGLVSIAAESNVTMELSHDDLEIFKNERLYFGQIISFPGTEGVPVRMISTDFIDIESYITVNVRVGDI
ncbi:MAG: hypothetical protein JW814_08450 [Candidatus Krumholzibacteriota bacterium]|nr:hypothetical protein [Candidatus Krumholzibacteriota bacterium]